MKIYLTILFALLSSPCFAAYTGNYDAKVSWIKIYNDDTIYFALESMPSDHQCTDNFFVLSPTLTEKQRDRYYSMLLAARASGAVVSVGYDKVNPDCIYGRPVVHALKY